MSRLPDRSAFEDSAKATTSPFRFLDLPKDLIVYMLRSMLFASEGYINPWLSRHEQEFLYLLSTGTSFLAWKKWLRPNILATCRELYNIGTPMIYGYNTFRLINRLAREQWFREDFLQLENLDYRDGIINFFTYKHKVFESNGRSFTILPRSQLIRHLKIQRSDIDDDDLACNGVSRVINTAKEGCNKGFLLSDKINERQVRDEEDEDMLELLELETKRRNSRENHRTQTRRLRWKFCGRFDCLSFFGGNLRTCNHHDGDVEIVGLVQKMTVQTLYIRGTGPSEREDGINHFTQEVMNWLSATKLKPKTVNFSGPFKERRIMEDGFVIPGEKWRAINTPLPAFGAKEPLELLDTENGHPLVCLYWASQQLDGNRASCPWGTTCRFLHT
ncbi:hypothetical protein N431DRAFT_510296 [Stipitochalara longipes BDJ]|nr:hypothetical protein N431DRAFT_510296 [Stipitochalara longipes BDJ]